MQFPRYQWALWVALLTCQAGYAASAAHKKTYAPVPTRKAGLWEVTVRSDDLVLRRQGEVQQKPQTVQMCTNAEAEPVMLFAIVPAQQNCRPVNVARRTKGQGGGYDINTECYVHDQRADAHMELRGDLQSVYGGAFSVKYAQTPMANTGRMVFEGRWLGACKPSQRPGDMVLPNGITVNVVDDRRRAEAVHEQEHSHMH